MRVLAVLCVIVAAKASAAEFKRVVGGPALDRGVHVSSVRDGGYIVVGATANTDGGDEDVLLVRFDAQGEVLWSRTHGGGGEENGWCVHEVGDGLTIAGFTKSTGAGGYDAYLLRTDADGQEGWSRTYGGPADDRCWGLLPLADGGYALVGETVNAASGAEDCWLLRTDAEGNELWSRTYGGEASDRAFAIAPAADGGFVLAGQTYSFGAGERDAYVIKTDSAGHEEWSRVFGGPARDVGHGIDRTDDGRFLVTGYTASFGAVGYDPYLIMIDAAGDTAWTRALPQPVVCRTLTGEEAANGGFFLTGFTHDPRGGSGAAALLRIDGDGRLEWLREFLPAPRGGQSFGYTVRATADGGCVVTGHTTVGSAGDLDLFLVKYGADARFDEDTHE
jgi:hypothetical protein